MTMRLVGYADLGAGHRSIKRVHQLAKLWRMVQGSIASFNEVAHFSRRGKERCRHLQQAVARTSINTIRTWQRVQGADIKCHAEGVLKVLVRAALLPRGSALAAARLEERRRIHAK